MRDLGVRRVVYTDINQDGTLAGPNLENTRKLAETTGMRVIASGGVSGPADVRALKALEPSGVEAVICGQALYAGRLKLEEAIEISEGAGHAG
jgi:phosphoribosylformimino-5-aminoimidazole carboxamide ribotide isomerase